MNNKFIIIFLIIVSSCSFKKNEPQNILKYREKNPVILLNVYLTRGRVEIKGWANNFIEIEVVKKIQNKLSGNKKFLAVDFNTEGETFNIIGNIPERVSGSIDFKIFVPYNLMKTSVEGNDCSVSVTDFLGDIEINNTRGNIEADFQGSILRITSDESIINVNINCENSSDIFIKNNESDINIKADKIRSGTFIDAKSVKGNIFMTINKDIPHRFSLTGKNVLDVKYDFRKIADMKGEYNYISGFIYDYSSKIDLTNVDGKITLTQKQTN